MRNLNDDLRPTRQTGGAATVHDDAPAIVPTEIDYAALGKAPLKGAGELTFRVRRLREVMKPRLGACVTAEILGGKA